ncbi:hypothetical protein [Microbacterium sp.]|uniref:hypothetical protein n=1 Tax=Microbacterium sp. TaxID=51671 RepID=UPI0039E66CAD
MSDAIALRKREDTAWTLWVVQSCIAICAVIYIWMRALSIPHCGLDCDTKLLQQALVAFFWTALGLAVLSAALLGVARSRLWLWMIPVVGLGLTVIAAFVANYVSDIALRFI